ncbi:MAG: aminodeoxychorismate/anthranilate synthase component II [Planctomycetes bacterium]|nr:aminodeoxychorismate/anthranilate synthase component II [Planctomycetota bacterium]
MLLIDNHDSFTFNLVQALRVLGAEVRVARNDELDLAAAHAHAPTHLVLSPGPGSPQHAGITPAILDAFLERVPILGVCLGHQAIGARFGGLVSRAAKPVHGKSSRVWHDGRGIFRGLPNPLVAGRYHSLCVSERGLAPELEISAWTAEGEVMGLRHRTLPIEGVQFHPESVLTPRGARLLAGFLALQPARAAEPSR